MSETEIVQRDVPGPFDAAEMRRFLDSFMYREDAFFVDEVVASERIVLTLNSKTWEKTKSEAYEVKVIFEFEALEDGHTMLSISEDGWKTDEDGLKGSHENCGGWTSMAMCLKGWIEHGIDLR